MSETTGENRMRAVGYIRVSTQDQATDGYGLQAQTQRITQEIERRDWELVSTLSDEGLSGKSLQRPRLMEALELIAAGEADALIVAKLDRLTRSVIDFSVLLEWFDRADGTLVALDFDLDTSTPGGRLIGHIMSAVAEWERGTIAQRTRDGLAEARRQGRPISRPSVMDSPDLMSRIRVMRDAEMSLQSIADRLNDEMVPTLRGAVMWRKSAIQSVLGYRRRSPRRSLVLPDVRRSNAR